MVSLQFGLLLTIFMGFGQSFINTGYFGIFAGIILLILGLLLGLSAVVSMKQPISVLPSPTKEAQLVVNGPYKFIRHPMYSALLLASLGITVAAPTVSRLLAIMCLFIVLTIKSRYEEKLLAEKFQTYRNLISKTGRFVPKFGVKYDSK